MNSCEKLRTVAPSNVYPQHDGGKCCRSIPVVRNFHLFPMTIDVSHQTGDPNCICVR